MNKSEKLLMEVIKEGIVSGNMNIVAKGYNVIMGEEVEPPKTMEMPKIQPDPRFEIVENDDGEIVEMRALENLVPTEQKEERDPYDFTVKKENNLRKRKPVTAPMGPNSFDPNEYANEDFSSEAGYENIDDGVAPAPRNRKPAPPAKIQCVECRETKTVPKSLVRENYTCDECIQSKIKGKRS